MTATRWNTVTPSQYPWERTALDFIRDGLPDHDPYRTWSNFEFRTADGAIYEVDLLVLTKQGFWLVEIKSRPGRVEGDAGTWTWTDRDGKRTSMDNPVLLANRKAKALSAVLKPMMAAQRVALPWLEPLVFLSDPEIQCNLAGAARGRVCLTDRAAAPGRAGRKGIVAALVNREAAGIEPTSRTAIDVRTAKALDRAMEQAGIRRSQKARRVGDYVLKQLLDESPDVYQDRLAEHAALPGVFCRVRQYLVAQAAGEDVRQRMKRAAAREFRTLQSFDHPGILDVRDYKDHEFGPALLFAYEPKAMRLDHFLATRGARLTADTRLEIMRQVADAVRYAHSKKVVHRALAPQSVLVMNPDAAEPRDLGIKVFNWQVGVRDSETASSATVHVQELVDRQATVYMAPESLLDPRAASEASDVFSLGAIAYHVFSGRSPGESRAEVVRVLEEHRGLMISAVLDGAGTELEDLIRRSTDPDVDLRIDSAAAFLEGLDRVEDELTDPGGRGAVDPADARPGDMLEGGFVVERFLGRGATGVALLARRGDDEVVLKVARAPDDGARLHAEGEAIRKVRSQFVVGLREVTEIGGRTVLVLDKAGDQTLADRLRKEGRLGLELLDRFGEDLLQAVSALEQDGVAHRDIKPDNIAVRSGKQRLQLVLFDFSLSRVPAEQVQVGTHPYLDPFLSRRRPPRWDLAAERYAAGATLYEMATGVLPRWGDGRSDPALTDAELTIEPERFDPAVRDGLSGFFRKALDRDPGRRFDNAEEMLRSWREVFTGAERRTVTTPAGDLVPLHLEVDQAEPDTLVAMLGLSTRATNALDRAGVTNVRQLLGLAAGEVRFMRGVGQKTRDEIIAVLDRLRRRLASEADTEKPASRPTPLVDDLVPDLDTMRRRLIDPPAHGRTAPAALSIRRAYLGFDGADAAGRIEWPTQAEVAVRLRKKRQQVSQALGADRERWSRDRHVTAVRDDLLGLIRSAGGVMSLSELAEALLASRPADRADPRERPALAAALIRIAYEAEQARTEPKLHLRRCGPTLLLAVTPELAGYAEALGRVADELAAEDPLPSSLRVFQRLYDVPPPEYPPDCPPPNNERILRLAAAAGARAAVSSRQELYPRRMRADRALQLGLGTLAGLETGAPEGQGDRLDPRAVRERIAARYPEAEPLPDHPEELARLLAGAGLDVVWDEPTGSFHMPRKHDESSASGSGRIRRDSTYEGPRRPARATDPRIAEAHQFEERLRYALRDGAFLAMVVGPREMLACERQLARRFPELLRVSLDRLLLEKLRARADEDEVDWQVVREADGAPPGSEDSAHLRDLVAEIVPAVEAELLASPRPILLVHPGLLARYDQMDLLTRLRDQVGRKGKCPALLVLVAADEQSELPLIDGRAVPLIGSGQRARVPRAWVNNEHRSGD